MLPTPNLDDRTFQGLVDDARRLVHRRCPEWSEHNISDPGITLIETVAMMVDQLIYRLNRVPERNYVKFLELLGLELRPPGAAQGEVTFWLSAPQPQTVTVRAETEVSTDRTDIEEPIVFSTTEQLDIVPCSLNHGRVVTVPAGGDPIEHTNEPGGPEFACFSVLPTPGDASVDRTEQRGTVRCGVATFRLSGVWCRCRSRRPALHLGGLDRRIGLDSMRCRTRRDPGVQPAR